MVGIKTWSKLYIAPDEDQSMILGEDWLKKNRVQINFHPTQLKLKMVKIPHGINSRSEFNFLIRQY